MDMAYTDFLADWVNTVKIRLRTHELGYSYGINHDSQLYAEVHEAWSKVISLIEVRDLVELENSKSSMWDGFKAALEAAGIFRFVNGTIRLKDRRLDG